MSSRKPEITVPPTRHVAVREIQLIDRDEEMHLLMDVADRAARGEGGVVFLYGEAGIGKTRLARELGSYARSQGMQVLSGRCPALFRMDGVPPYVLWREVIRDYFKACTPEQLYKVIGYYPAEVCKLVPELDQKLRVVPKSLPISHEHERNRLFEAVSQFVINISREAPLAVVLDDLQWTDQSSLLLLHYLARGIYGESLLLVGAYRDTYINKKHPLSPVLTELNRERLLQSVPLKRMSFDDASEMIKRILEQDDVPRRFCELIYEKTRGNPFFVEEAIRSLKEEEVIYREKDKWKIREVSKIKFPETVKGVINARVGRLDDDCQRVLTLASFVGKDFTFEALRGVSNLREGELLEIVEKLLKTGLIEVRTFRGEDVCSFADIIVRDVLYEGVNPLRRKRLHRVIGSALEKMYAEKIDEHVGELALHFLESGDKEKALDYFLKAGEKAANIYANNEAVSYFQSALKLLEEKEGKLRQKARVLERLGDIKRVVGEFDASVKDFNDALMFSKQLDEKETASRLHRKIANILFAEMANWEKAKEHLTEALKNLETQPENLELARLYISKARLCWLAGDMVEALSWAEKALDLARKLNDSEVITRSYLSLGKFFSMSGDMKKGSEYLERALKMALDNGYVETALSCYVTLGSLLPAEENERRLECGQKGSELAKKVGDVTFQSWFGINLADMYIGMGNVSVGMSIAEESAALDRKAGNMGNLSLSTVILAYSYQILGEWNKSEQYYNEALSISQKVSLFWSSELYASLGQFHLACTQDYAKARENLEKACEICARARDKQEEMIFSTYLTWTYIELGEIRKAKNLLDKLHKFALQAKDKDLIAKADALRAMLFRAQKRWKSSVEHFEKSLQEHEALNARRWNIYRFAKMVLLEYARVYIERDQEGDREKAHKLLNQALEIFQKIGARKDTERTRSKLAYLETEGEMAEPELAKVPEGVLPSHVMTGYEELDDLLFGGIPTNYAVVLTSPSCDERDLLIKNFLEAGVREGQVTFHVATNATIGVKSLAEEFQSDFYLFVCNPQADKIIKSLPNVFKLKGVENLTDINIALSSALRKLDKPTTSPRRILIEIVSDVLLQHHTVQTRKWLNALIPDLKSKGFTTMAVMDPEIHPQQEVRAIVGIFDGEINIHDKETDKGLQKFLQVKKMTNQKYSNIKLPVEKEKL